MEMVDNYLSWTFPGVGRPLVFMVLQGIVFFLILYIIETDIVGRLLKVMTPNRVGQAMLTEMNADEDGKISEDSDVANERQRIQSNPIQELVKTDSVVIQDLTKLYGNFVAVNQLSIGVSQKECFGLLGVNGAGKTTDLQDADRRNPTILRKRLYCRDKRPRRPCRGASEDRLLCAV